MRTIIIKTIAAGLTALLGAGMLSSPAQADVVQVTVDSANATIGADADSVRVATDVNYEYSDSDYDTDTVRLQVWNPSGKAILDQTKRDQYGWAAFRYPVSKVGTYRTTATVTAYDQDGAVIDSMSDTDSFTVIRQPTTRLRVRPVHVRHGFWRITGTLTKGGTPWVGRKVTVQFKYAGYWFNLKTKRTVRQGKVYFTAQPKAGARKYPLRLHTSATNRTQAANSRTFRIYP